MENILEGIKKRKYSLFLFVFVLVSTTGFLSLFLSNTFSFLYFRDTTESQIHESHIAVLDLFVDNIEKDVKFGFAPDIYRKCDALYKSKSVLEVKVLSEDNKICDFSREGTSSETLKSFIYYDDNKKGIAATIQITFDTEFNERIRDQHVRSVLLSLLFIMLLLCIPLYWISRRITSPIEELANLLPQGDVSKINSLLEDKDSNIKEIIDLYESIRKMAKEIKRYEFENLEKAKKESLYKQASEIVHDIRNPILRLKLKIPDLISDINIKNHINNDLEFIEELTRVMLSEYKSNFSDKTDTSKLIDISKIIERNIFDFQSSYPLAEFKFINNLNQVGAYLEIFPLSFSRILQNLLKNACEAEGSRERKITVTLNLVDDFYEISVLDNGNGISKNIINKITDPGFTHGKPSGTGIGLSYCKDEINRFNGKFEIHSVENEFAEFKVSFPAQKSPIWGFRTLYLNKKSSIVIVDDEIEIHSYWKSLSKKLNFPQNEIKMFNLKSELELKRYLDTNSLDNVKFIFDYDLKESKGSELIKKYNLDQISTIVSNHYDDIGLLDFCEVNGVKLFQKQSIANLEVKIIEYCNNPHEFDLVFIDDDNELLNGLRIYCDKQNLKAACFLSLDDVFKNFHTLNKDIKFFVDLNSKDPEDGVFITRELYSLGFKNLYLFSGEKLGKEYFWIKDEISKADLQNVLDLVQS